MKRFLTVLLIVILFIFSISAWDAGKEIYGYYMDRYTYESFADEFTGINDPNFQSTGFIQKLATPEPEDIPEEEKEIVIEPLPEVAPITVDFAGLKEINEDVVGWIYCEDTIINYPIMQGTDNDEYLDKLLNGKYSYGAGSIMMDFRCDSEFNDYNSIIYGHHMQDSSLFGSLDRWAKQAYYDEHPVFWILTPTQDYKAIIVDGYFTRPDSDTYTIVHRRGMDLDNYMEAAKSESVLETSESYDPIYKYVTLSTCAYVWRNARFVLHCKLVPVSSIGGYPFVVVNKEAE